MLLAVLLALPAGCGSPAAPAPPPAAGLLVYGLDGGLRASAALGRDPLAVALASDGATAYVSDNAAGVVRAVAVPRLRLRWQAAVGGRPGPLLAVAGRLLVSLFESAQVAELDPSDGRLLARHPVGPGPGQLLLAAGRVLVACSDGRVWDLAGGSRPAGPGFALGLGAGGTWASDQAGGALVRLEDGRRLQLPPGLHPFWAAAGPEGSLWVTAEGADEDADPGAVVVVDGSLRPRVVAAPRDPDALAAAGGRVYVAAHGERELLVLDSAGRRLATWGRGSSPVAVAVDTRQALLVVVTNARE